MAAKKLAKCNSLCDHANLICVSSHVNTPTHSAEIIFPLRYIILICSTLNTVYCRYSRVYLSAIAGASENDEICEKTRRRGGFTPRRRVYVANSLTISGYRDEREIQNGAETSVKTAVKRSNYAIARYLQRCILYRHACGRTGGCARVKSLSQTSVNYAEMTHLKINVTKKPEIFIKHLEIYRNMVFFLSFSSMAMINQLESR